MPCIPFEEGGVSFAAMPLFCQNNRRTAYPYSISWMPVRLVLRTGAEHEPYKCPANAAFAPCKRATGHVHEAGSPPGKEHSTRHAGHIFTKAKTHLIFEYIQKKAVAKSGFQSFPFTSTFTHFPLFAYSAKACSEKRVLCRIPGLCFAFSKI